MALLLGVNRIVAARGVVSAVAACPQAVFISQPRFTPLQVRHKGRAPACATDQKYFGWQGKNKEKNAKAETKKPATEKPAAKKPAAKKPAAKKTAAKEIAAKKTAAKKTAAKEIAAKEIAAKKTAKEIAAKEAAAKEIAAKETAAKEVAEKAAGTQAVKKPFRFAKAKSRAKNAQSVFDKTGKEKYDFMRKDGAPILHLVDASDWIYRSFYAMPPFLKKHGTPTGAVIGFSSSLVTLISSLRPGDMIGLAFDAGKTWRNSEMPAYKTGRKSPPSLRLQIPECRRAAEALLGEQHCLSVPGMEADDIIAEIVKEHCPATPYTIAIHTRDQDFLQLVTENITVVRKFKGVYERVGPKEVDEHFGLPPEQLACYWALVGQAADSVSGVPGVGPKTAKGIIKALGNLESVFDPKHQDTLEEACGRRVALTLPEHEETCILGRRIMQLPSPHPPVPCWDGAKPTEQLAYAANNFAKGDQYLEYWGFNSLKKQYAKTQVLSA